MHPAVNQVHKIALSVDIEDWYHTPMVTGSSFSAFRDVNEFFKNWQGSYDKITGPTLKILDLFTELKITATFFVVADVVSKYPEIVAALKSSPHEIGCHGLHHHAAIDGKTKKMLQPKEKWEEELFKAKEILERTFQKEIIGYRAPGGFFGGWMVPILEKAGFKYDSSVSLNSLYNKTDNRQLVIPQKPYRINLSNLTDMPPSGSMIELPWSNIRMAGINWPAGGAFFFRALGLRFFRHALKQNLKEHDTMFYFHSLDICNEKIPLSNFRKRPFYWINKGDKTFRKVKKLLLCFRDSMTTCGDVYNRAIHDLSK
jgi:peptidoglycan/xylan/chitin deacetylase (PgdA/CDA1 family)